jgi:hypothetical protein
MPSMPRSDDKPKKIAFDILGTPPNMRKRKGKKSKLSEHLAKEEVQRPKSTSI